MFSVLRSLSGQVIIVVLIGGFISICANLFVSGLRYFEQFRRTADAGLSVAGFDLNLWTAGLLIGAFILVSALRRFTQIPKWENPADIIYSAQNQQYAMPARNGILTIIAGFVSLAGGASLGQYGPLVHLGGSIGITLSRWLKGLWLGRDVMIGCAVAAAISAGFNAPIAGIIFAHEAVLRHFSARAIALISISSLCASALGRALFEPVTIFEMSTDFIVTSDMVIVSLIAGIFFGISAILFIRCLFMVNKLASHSKAVSRWFAGLGLAFLVMLTQILPDAMGMGMGIINALFSEISAPETLLILLVAKLAAIVISANIGFSGGFVGPALFVGAVIGALLAHLATVFGLSSMTMMLVVAGSAAVAGTVFGAPLAMVILVLELTHSYDLTVAAMLSIVVSSLICHLFYGHSLFDLQLLARGIDLAKGRVFLELEMIKMNRLPSDEYLIFVPDMKGDKILQQMQKQHLTEAYCVAPDGQFAGKISIFDVVNNPKGTAEQFADAACLKLYANQSMNDAMRIATDFVGEGLPVIDDQTNQLIAVVSEAQLFHAYSDVTERVRNIETA